MPQQPASASSTATPGMRPSSALAGATRPIDRWWQCPCNSTRAGPEASGSEAAREAAYSSNDTLASATTRALRRASPRSSAGASSRTAERQLGSQKTSGRPAAASS